MPCALAPAYGVTSICRFIQAATALSIAPPMSARCLCYHWGCSLFCLISVFYMLLPPSRPSCFSISSRPTASLSGPSPCLYTAGAYCLFVEVVGLEPHVPDREQIYSLSHLTTLPNLLICLILNLRLFKSLRTVTAGRLKKPMFN